MSLALDWIKVTMKGLCFGLDQGNHEGTLLWVGSGGRMGRLCFGLDQGAALRG